MSRPEPPSRVHHLDPADPDVTPLPWILLWQWFCPWLLVQLGTAQQGKEHQDVGGSLLASPPQQHGIPRWGHPGGT